MKLRNSLKYIFCVAATVGVVLSAGMSIAEQRSASAKPVHKALYELPESAPVVLYGVELSPHLDKYFRPDYTSYKWNDLRHIIPGLLPDAKSVNLSSNQVCDLFDTLSKAYGARLEVSEGKLAYMLKDKFPDINQEPELVDEVIKRLQSSDPDKLNELLKWLPNDVDKVMVTKDLTLKYLAMAYVHDAAMDNCQDYAKEKGYYSYFLPYTGDDAPKN